MKGAAGLLNKTEGGKINTSSTECIVRWACQAVDGGRLHVKNPDRLADGQADGRAGEGGGEQGEKRMQY